MKKILVILLTVILSLPARAADDEIYLPIIMYHEVRPDKCGKDAILPEEFEEDLRYLADNGYTAIFMGELIDYVYDGRPLPDRPIVISFDDAYLNNYTYALPLLEKYGARAVLSVIGRAADEFTAVRDEDPAYAHLSWPRLGEMVDTGLIELQNHSYDMHKTGPRVGCLKLADESGTDYERIFTSDVGLMQERMYERFGTAPSTFTYPYGETDAGCDAILAEMGFRATLSCDFGINRISHDPECLFMLRRICRSHGRPLSELLPGPGKD